MRITKRDVKSAFKVLAERLPKVAGHSYELEMHSPGDGMVRYRVGMVSKDSYSVTTFPLSSSWMMGASQAYDSIWQAVHLLKHIEQYPGAP